MNKTTAYENRFVIPALHRHLVNSSGQPQETFTEKEQKLFKILSKTNGQTLIAISIRNRISSGSIRGFREMIKELNDQRLVAPNELIRAIGREAVDLIASIS